MHVRRRLDDRLAELESQLLAQRSRRDAAHEQLHTLGSSLSGSRATLRQLLRALKFVSRPQGWSRRDDQSEIGTYVPRTDTASSECRADHLAPSAD